MNPGAKSCHYLMLNISETVRDSTVIHQQYRRQNAVSVTKTRERNNDNKHILYLSVRQSRLAGRTHNVLDLSLRLPVCNSFLSSSATNLWMLYVNNKGTDFNANWHKSSPGATSWTVKLGGQEVKGQDQRRPKLCLEAWRRYHSRSLSRVDRGIQWATKMLPLKRGAGAGGGVLHIVLTAARRVSDVRRADALGFITQSIICYLLNWNTFCSSVKIAHFLFASRSFFKFFLPVF